MHYAQNPIVTRVNESYAKAKVALHFHSVDTQAKTSVQLGGHYLDEFRKDDNQWRIVKSLFIVNSLIINDFYCEQNKITCSGNSMPA